MPRLTTLAALTAALVLTLASPALADADVTIGDDGVEPQTVRVDIREAIIWTNATDADVSLVGEDPTWESGPIEPGATFSIEITRAGTYSYGSEDGSLSGEIVVGSAGGGNDGGATEEPTEAAGGNAQDDDVAEQVDRDEEALPETGIDPVVPAALSLLLIGFGGALLVVTPPLRRL